MEGHVSFRRRFPNLTVPEAASFREMPILPRANHGPAPAGLSLLQGAVRNRSTAAPDAHRERNGARLLQIFCGAGSRHCRPGIVDFCIVSPVVREADEQVRAQQARLAVVFANTSASAALWSFRCEALPETHLSPTSLPSAVPSPHAPTTCSRRVR